MLGYKAGQEQNSWPFLSSRRVGTVGTFVGSPYLDWIVSAWAVTLRFLYFSYRCNPVQSAPVPWDMATNQKVGSSNLSGRAMISII